MRCAKAKGQVADGRWYPLTPNLQGCDNDDTDAGSKRTIEGKLGLCHRRPSEAKGPEFSLCQLFEQ